MCCHPAPAADRFKNLLQIPQPPRLPPPPSLPSPQVLASSHDNLDAASSGTAALWQVLNLKYGVLLMGASDPEGLSLTGAAAAAPGEGTAALPFNR